MAPDGESGTGGGRFLLGASAGSGQRRADLRDGMGREVQIGDGGGGQGFHRAVRHYTIHESTGD